MKYFSYCSQQCFTSVTTTPFEEVIPTLFTAVSVLQVLQQHLSKTYLPCCSQQSEFYRCYNNTFQRCTYHAVHSGQSFTGVTTTPFKDILAMLFTAVSILQVLQQHLSKTYFYRCYNTFQRCTCHAVHSTVLQVLNYSTSFEEVLTTLFTQSVFYRCYSCTSGLRMKYFSHCSQRC